MSNLSTCDFYFDIKALITEKAFIMNKISRTVSLKKANQKKFTKDASKIKKKLRSGQITVKNELEKPSTGTGRGVVYLGHIPHGFYEEEMSAYFKQFGKVTKVLLCRSPRTGKSKGFAFIEFLHPEVAEVVAETMNNYLMFKRRLVASYIPPEKQNPNLFKGQRITDTHIPDKINREKFIEIRNKDIDESVHKKHCRKRFSKINKKINLLQELGIEHDLKPVDVPKTIFNKRKREEDVSVPVAKKRKMRREGKVVLRKPSGVKKQKIANESEAKKQKVKIVRVIKTRSQKKIAI